MSVFSHDPWPNQLQAFTETQRAFDEGCRMVAVTSVTGGGKSRMMFEQIQEHNGRALVLANRRMLLAQLARNAKAAGFRFGFRAADHKELVEASGMGMGYNKGDDPGDRELQLAMTQSECGRVLTRGEPLHPAEVVIVDECFVGETEVLTTAGPRRIDNVRCGDMVYTAFGIGEVISASCRQSCDIYRLELSNGATIRCTGTHRIFTGCGWVEARAVENGSVVFGPEAVCFLWEGLGAKDYRQEGRAVRAPREVVERAEVLLSILREEASKPNEQVRNSPKGEQVAQVASAQADQEGRERATAALASASDPACSWGWLGGGVRCSHEDAERFGIPDLLQDRHSESRGDDRDRAGRSLPLPPFEAGAGRQEDDIPGWLRVERVSRDERGGSEAVFNLHVSGHPSYFANGILVHNCHLHTSDRICELLRRYVANGSRVVGYSATPVDLRDVGYDRLITAGTTSEMRACGALVPEVRYAPDEPDMRGEKPSYSTGEFSENQVMDAMFGRMIDGDHKKPPIIGRVLESWLKYSPVHSHTLLFAPSVAASVWFAEAFLDAGYRSCSIDGEHIWLDGVTRDSHEPGLREEVANLHKAGEIKVVCNRFVLREGIDWPWIRCGIFATVFGGLASFIQSGGRLLRAFPGKDSVCVIDHGGNWHRHGSLNADRGWVLGLTNHEITQERQERFREPPPPGENKPPEPIVCTKCARVRSGTNVWSPKCPFCGHIANAKSRLVMTHDGQLYERRGDVYRQHKVETKSDTQKIWESCYWRAKKSRKGMTFQQARALFFIENNYYPPKDLPMMPERAIDWRRRVSDVPRNLLISDPSASHNQGD